MNARPTRFVVAGALAFAMACGACGGPGTTGPTTTPAATSSGGIELTIFGAASLRSVLNEVMVAYEAATPGTSLVITTDSSAALETQIEHGAPADVFLSADTQNPQKLVDGGYAVGAPRVFARNALAIVVPDTNPAGLTSPADLAKPGVKIVAAAAGVPITTYATALVANLAREPGYPAAFDQAYEANVVSREDNVQAVLGKIALGEGDAGIVYVTDAAGSADVRTIQISDRANVAASHAGVVVGTSTETAAAQAFLDWLVGPEGQAILRSFAFLPPVA